jgi:hypothetical protein
MTFETIPKIKASYFIFIKNIKFELKIVTISNTETSWSFRSVYIYVVYKVAIYTISKLHN